MARRFTLAGLLLAVTLVGLSLAIAAPLYRWRTRSPLSGFVVSLAASADGSTFAALLGDGTILVWDSAGRHKRTIRAEIAHQLGRLELSHDGKLAAFWGGDHSMRATRAAIEIWDIDAEKWLKIIPAPPLADFAFLPSEHLLAVQSEVLDDVGIPAYPADQSDENADVGDEAAANVDWQPVEVRIHSLTDDAPTRTFASAGRVGFSPDATMFAVLTNKNQVRIHEAATLAVLQQFDVPEGAAWTDLAWSPDGRSLSFLKFHEQGQTCWQTVENFQRVSGDLQTKDLENKNDNYSTAGFYDMVAYLPSGRGLALAGRFATGMTLLDATNLKSPFTSGSSGVFQLAAGLRGDAFVTAGEDGAHPSGADTHVDLCDVATFRPRRRLWEQTPPNVWPAGCGLAVWLVVFVVRIRRWFARGAKLVSNSR
ncbi:MAG TPA: WD40 repeat domain-containing protein [Pirellulales bacterium]|nr:WD40 repeat domain-containing protein [Pirellulales bacterium]